MSRRAITVLLLGLTLAAGRSLGLHFHLPEKDAGDRVVATQPAAFETPHHHADHGAEAASQADDQDVDVDEPATGVSKGRLPEVPSLLVGLAGALLVSPTTHAAPTVSPPFRPPRIPSHRSLLPPSHAPPRTV